MGSLIASPVGSSGARYLVGMSACVLYYQLGIGKRHVLMSCAMFVYPPGHDGKPGGLIRAEQGAVQGSLPD